MKETAIQINLMAKELVPRIGGLLSDARMNLDHKSPLDQLRVVFEHLESDYKSLKKESQMYKDRISDLSTALDQFKSNNKRATTPDDSLIRKDLEMIMKEKDRMNDKYAEMVQIMKQTTDELKQLKGENEKLRGGKHQKP